MQKQLLLSADHIFDGKQLLQNHCLTVSEDGTILKLEPLTRDHKDIQYYKGIISPGFVNAHCHIELSHMKDAVTKHTGMVGFIKQVMQSKDKIYENKSELIEQSVIDMYNNGINAVGDICNTTDALNSKLQHPKMQFQNYIECIGLNPERANGSFEYGKTIAAEYTKHFPAKQVNLVPHAPYTVSSQLATYLNTTQPNSSTIHNEESQAEMDFIESKSGEIIDLYQFLNVPLDFFAPFHTTPLQHNLQTLLPASGKVLLVHNCHFNQSDIGFLEKYQSLQDIYFCVCPNANLYIGNPLPDINLLLATGKLICIGTDGLSSNYGLDILSEIKVLAPHYPSISTAQWLTMATSNGAAAIDLNDKVGSFTPNTRPGVLLLENITNQSLTENTICRRLF